MNIVTNIILILILVGAPAWFIMKSIMIIREEKQKEEQALKDYQEYSSSFVPELEEIDTKAPFANRAVLKIESAYRLVSYKLDDKQKIPCMAYYNDRTICCPAFSEQLVDDIKANCYECKHYISRMEKITRFWLSTLENLDAAYIDNQVIRNSIFDCTYTLSKKLRDIPPLKELQKITDDINNEWYYLKAPGPLSINPYFYTSQEELDKDRKIIRVFRETIAKQNLIIKNDEYAMCFPGNKIAASLNKLSEILDSYTISDALVTPDDIRGLECQPVSQWDTDKIFRRIKTYFSLEADDRKKYTKDIREIMDAIVSEQRAMHDEMIEKTDNRYLANTIPGKACNE